jgi:hypothetical protein
MVVKCGEAIGLANRMKVPRAELATWNQIQFSRWAHKPRCSGEQPISGLPAALWPDSTTTKPTTLPKPPPPRPKPAMPFDLASRKQTAARLSLVSHAGAPAAARTSPLDTCALGYKDQAGGWVWQCPDCGPRSKECIGLS